MKKKNVAVELLNIASLSEKVAISTIYRRMYFDYKGNKWCFDGKEKTYEYKMDQ